MRELELFYKPNQLNHIVAYKKRFDIEEMFRDFKKGGYNLESTAECNQII